MSGNTIPKEAVDLIKSFEALRLGAYICPAGKPTLGWGHTLGVKMGQRVSEDEAELLLAADLLRCGVVLDRAVSVPLTDMQYGALASFIFNVGGQAFRRSTLLRKLNAGDYSAVPSELARWVHGRDPRTGRRIKFPGLVRRRKAEADLWRAA